MVLFSGMAHTAAQLQAFADQLDECISEGALRVNLEGVVVTYNTLTEMRSARNDYLRQRARILRTKPVVSTIDQSTAW